MFLCLKFGFLDPDDLLNDPRLTPRVYKKWFRFFERNACHPLALQATIGQCTAVVAALGGSKNAKRTKITDYIPYVPKEKVDFNDPAAIEEMLGVM